MDNRTTLNRLFYAAISLVVVIVIGIIGFMYFEGDSLLNSAFMTIITIPRLLIGPAIVRIHRVIPMRMLIYTGILSLSSLSTSRY